MLFVMGNFIVMELFVWSFALKMMKRFYNIKQLKAQRLSSRLFYKFFIGCKSIVKIYIKKVPVSSMQKNNRDQ